jgi:hypothetical protein
VKRHKTLVRKPPHPWPALRWGPFPSAEGIAGP